MDFDSFSENPAEKYGEKVSDYQEGTERFCPMLMKAVIDGAPLQRLEFAVRASTCKGPRCAWWDADKERCAVLSLARNR